MAVVLLTLLALVVLAAPAQAHTALIGSDPPTGERLAYSPDEVVLSFAAPVDVQTVSVELRSAEGQVVPLVPLTTGRTAEVVAFDVPRLSRDVYGLAWQSVGDDGHRVSGEIVFGVGATPGLTQIAGDGADPVTITLDAAALLSRAIWYLALALVCGLLVLRRAQTFVAALATRRVAAALMLLGGAALLRGIVGSAAVLQAGGGAERAFGSRPPVLWLVVAAGVWLAARQARRPEGATWSLTAGTGAAWWVMVAAALCGGILAGHAPTRPDPIRAVAFGVTHLGAAALWVGPLLVLALFTRTPAWSALSSAERSSEVRAAVATFAPVAGWALAAVTVSGGLLALRAFDGDGFRGAFLVALVTKTIVVAAVAVPLGVLHHRRRARWDGLPRTVPVEVAALLVAVVLGSVLVGVDPGWTGATGGTDLALAALLDGNVEDPADCAALDVGRAACYRSSFGAILVAQGPQAAIDRVAELSQTDPQVAADCHQVAHDLGNDAAERIPDMATALAVDGSVCWSGYYHGFVEARLAAIDPDELVAQLPAFCDGAAEPRYSFTHYNCVHGLGHGLMLLADADLFAALPLCRQAGEDWVIRSCASGAFMENVMAAQQGLDVSGLDDENLLYPCTELEDMLAQECYLMQTSHILWRLNGDIAGGFAWCDTARQEYQATCYRSMGRDISGRTLLDAEETARQCNLGSADLRRWCIDGAASNAVYQSAGTEQADQLCQIVVADLQQACRDARDQAATTVASG
ncbi:MAG: copper resistance protein CopC [Euzebya sp.]